MDLNRIITRIWYSQKSKIVSSMSIVVFLLLTGCTSSNQLSYLPAEPELDPTVELICPKNQVRTCRYWSSSKFKRQRLGKGFSQCACINRADVFR